MLVIEASSRETQRTKNESDGIMMCVAIAVVTVESFSPAMFQSFD